MKAFISTEQFTI